MQVNQVILTVAKIIWSAGARSTVDSASLNSASAC